MSLEDLTLLTGKWKGKGNANFPTISSTDYIEELEFKTTGDGETLFFEQKTWHTTNGQRGDVLHQESGYIVAYPDNTYELLNAQNSKRVEVMKCTHSIREKQNIYLLFESKYFGNDERMIRTTRNFYLEGDKLRYVMKMETKMTPEFQQHLEAILERCS